MKLEKEKELKGKVFNNDMAIALAKEESVNSIPSNEISKTLWAGSESIIAFNWGKTSLPFWLPKGIGLPKQ